MENINIYLIVDLLSVIVPSIVSVISVIIAVKSLKTTKKSIEDANRPYIVCYVTYTDVGYFSKYLIIKNFGRSPAIIRNIKTDRKVSEFEENRELKSLTNSTIAPNQKFTTAIPANSKEKYIFKITYEELSGKLVTKEFIVNFGFSSDLRHRVVSQSKLTADTNEIRAALHHIAKSEL